MNRSGDVLILGGGVIGLTTAYYLAREGLSVLLCDQGKIGMESSWAGAGILSPSNLEHAQFPDDRLRAISFQMFPALSQELKDRTGIDNDFLRCGAIEFTAHSPDAFAHEWYGLGVATQPLSESELANLEPALARGLGPTILIPDTAQLRNPRHMKALRAACIATKKVTFLEDAAVRELVVEKGRVKAVRAGNELLTGPDVLVAAGAWTDQLLAPLGIKLRVEPVRGQIALLNPGHVIFRHVLAAGAKYLVPRSDGRVLIGSTEEHAGFDKSTTAEAIANLLALGIKLVPALANATLEKTWAGLRPGSPDDGLPFIGPAPGYENLWVAAGHFRAGIQLSRGTALALKEMILGQPLTMPMDAFRIDR